VREACTVGARNLSGAAVPGASDDGSPVHFCPRSKLIVRLPSAKMLIHAMIKVTYPIARRHRQARLADLGQSVFSGSAPDFGRLIAADTERRAKWVITRRREVARAAAVLLRS